MHALRSDPPGRPWRIVLMGALAGVAVTVGAALAMTATDQALFCGSCHSMSEAALSHKRSAHAKLACNECHAPNNLAAKLPFKAKEGTRDIYSTTLGTIPDLIHPGGETKDVVQANCRRCHVASTMTVSMEVKKYCTDCHRSVPHTPKLPIARRSAADV